jgi:hypothetical protein
MFHIDDYAILDCHYIVHAVPINPCAEHDGRRDHHRHRHGDRDHALSECCCPNTPCPPDADGVGVCVARELTQRMVGSVLTRFACNADTCWPR